MVSPQHLGVALALGLLLPRDEDDMDDDDDDRAPRPRVEDTDEDASKHQLACWVLRETRFVGSADEASKRLPWAATRQRLVEAFVDPTLGEEVAVYCTQQLVALAEAPDGVVDLLDDMRSWLCLLYTSPSPRD